MTSPQAWAYNGPSEPAMTPSAPVLPPPTSAPWAPPPGTLGSPGGLDAPSHGEASPWDFGAAQGAPSGLTAQDVSAWFGSKKVLERISLAMEPGKVTALIGPSGCGKSTFLRTLNRMHELVPGSAFSGSVSLDGTDIYGPSLPVTDTRLRIGMVFQKPEPLPVDDHCAKRAVGPQAFGSQDRQSRCPGQELPRAGGPVARSPKPAQRAGRSYLGRPAAAAVHRPSVWPSRPSMLLMDEPCSALDPISTGVIEETIRELCKDITIVIVTHNMQQAQRVSHNCALFLVGGETEPGQIVEAGPTEQMFGDPVDPRTSDYVHGRFG